jgi:hypothetical protein
VPVVEMLREAGMIGDGTETEAYMRIARHRDRMMRTHEWTSRSSPACATSRARRRGAERRRQRSAT